MKIEELDFTVRTYHALKRAGINTSEQIQQMDDDDLYRLRNIGKLSVAEIREKLPYIPPEKIELPTMTNADKIRAMSDHEIARFLDHVHWTAYESRGDFDKLQYPPDTIGWKDWLRQPAKEEAP